MLQEKSEVRFIEGMDCKFSQCRQRHHNIGSALVLQILEVVDYQILKATGGPKDLQQLTGCHATSPVVFCLLDLQEGQILGVQEI